MVPARTLIAFHVAAMSALLCVLAGCQRTDTQVSGSSPNDAAATHSSAQSTPATATPLAVPAADFDADLAAWRHKRLQELMDPQGYLGIVARHWLEPGETATFGSAADNRIRTDAGPARLGSVHLQEGEATITPAPGQTFVLQGATHTAAFVLPRKGADDKPLSATYDGGRGSIALVSARDRVGLRIRHADSPTLKRFDGVERWPGDPRWQVKAKFVAHAPGTRLAYVNVLGMEDSMPNPGAVEFTLDGKPQRLEAFDDGVPGQLFFVFGDGSNGHGSYGGGRFLEASVADARGEVLLDFNRAFNPPCAYSAYTLCPLPPTGNRLLPRIEAGERAPARKAPSSTH